MSVGNSEWTCVGKTRGSQCCGVASGWYIVTKTRYINELNMTAVWRASID